MDRTNRSGPVFHPVQGQCSTFPHCIPTGAFNDRPERPLPRDVPRADIGPAVKSRSTAAPNAP